MKCLIYMRTISITFAFLSTSAACWAAAFVSSSTSTSQRGTTIIAASAPPLIASVPHRTLKLRATKNDVEPPSPSRRRFLASSAATAAAVSSAALLPSLLFRQAQPGAAHAAVGSLYEYSQTNAILQGVTVNVADPAQEKAMITFLEDAFDCQILRKRIRGTITETWLGFGPEQLSLPSDFTFPVSSLAKYGGHASIHLVYDSRAPAPLYRTGDETPPGNNIAYLQLGVPAYRISQMVKNGAAVLDAYGIVNVISPAGLPMRGIVGIAPDPIMFVAINCADVAKSQAFYQQLGFVQQDYPYCRPNQGQGQFEPPQPPNSVYLGPSQNGMGILLLPTPKRSKRVTPNPAVDSLHVVYSPTTAAAAAAPGDGEDDDDNNNNKNSVSSAPLRLVDPSGVALEFQSVADFEAEEQITR